MRLREHPFRGLLRRSRNARGGRVPMTDMTMTDMTIKAIRTTMLQRAVAADAVAQGPCLRRRPQFLVLEVETKGGIVGMGYLFLFRPGIRTIAACLEETHHPARHRQGRERRRGDLAGSLASDHDLRPRRHRHHGDVGARHRAVGRARQARQPAAASAVGAFSQRVAGLRLAAASAAPAATA